jgi:hypothetical protein
MGRKKITIDRIADPRSRQVRTMSMARRAIAEPNTHVQVTFSKRRVGLVQSARPRLDAAARASTPLGRRSLLALFRTLRLAGGCDCALTRRGADEEGDGAVHLVRLAGRAFAPGRRPPRSLRAPHSGAALTTGAASLTSAAPSACSCCSLCSTRTSCSRTRATTLRRCCSATTTSTASSSTWRTRMCVASHPPKAPRWPRHVPCWRGPPFPLLQRSNGAAHWLGRVRSWRTCVPGARPRSAWARRSASRRRASSTRPPLRARRPSALRRGSPLRPPGRPRPRRPCPRPSRPQRRRRLR